MAENLNSFNRLDVGGVNYFTPAVRRKYRKNIRSTKIRESSEDSEGREHENTKQPKTSVHFSKYTHSTPKVQTDITN